jgi:hypothetical protein
VLTSKDFLVGFAAGVAACYLYHHFAKPLPGPNVAARRQMGS